jgi:hypothetical protein
VFVTGPTVSIGLGRNLLAEPSLVLRVFQAGAAANIHVSILRRVEYRLESLCVFVLQPGMVERRRAPHDLDPLPILPSRVRRWRLSRVGFDRLLTLGGELTRNL